MINRVKKAIDKLFFCLRISADAGTFFSLLRQTKKLRWAAGNPVPLEEQHTYRLNLTGSYADIFLRTYAGDITMLYEIFLNKSYRFNGMDAFNPATIVDLGAHIGMSALYFSKNFPDADIYCIEPDEDNFALLENNTAGSKRITPIRAAISDADGNAVIEKSRFSYNSAIHTGEGSNAIRTITMATLFNELHLTHIDLLKIDIEGYEKKILAGDILWLANVSRIIIEVHSPEDEAVSLSTLKQHGFAVSKLHNEAMDDSIYYAVKE